MAEYVLFAYKATPAEAEQIDKVIQLSQTGAIPGHHYKDRGDLMRTAVAKLIEDVQRTLKDPDAVMAHILELIREVRDVKVGDAKANDKVA
jgi:hypothetical protein